MDRESIQERFGIIGNSPAIHHVIDRMRQVAKTDISVLIQGESGAGKELIAQGIHELSDRRHQSLTIVNCGAIPEGLIESELFGAEKGAYTGAVEKRSGYFEDADGSTVFLDEIGEMPQSAQVRLLRVLESGEYSRVGATSVRHTDVRVIAATNKDLAREVENGRFREDLYYRLSTVLITIPPLRERTDDILPIFDTFMHRFSQEYNASAKSLTDDAEALLKRYRWPGNVRELRNVAEQVVVLLREESVTAEDIKPYLRGVSTQESLMPVRQNDGEESARERELVYRMLLEMRIELRGLKEQLARLASSISVAVPRNESGEEEERGDYIIVREGEKSNLPAVIEDVPYEIENDRRESQAESRRESLAREGRSAFGESRSGARGEGGLASERRSSGSMADEAYREIWEDKIRREETAGSSRHGDAAGVDAGGGTVDTASNTHGDATDDRSGTAPGSATGTVSGTAPSDAAPSDSPEEMPTLEAAERRLINQALERFDGNRRQTAEALGISERTLYRKLKEVED